VQTTERHAALLKESRHEFLSRAAYRKFGASRSFFARCGIPQASPQACCGSHRSTRVPYVRTSVRGPKRWAKPFDSRSFRTLRSLIWGRIRQVPLSKEGFPRISVVRGLAGLATKLPFSHISSVTVKIFHCFRWTCALFREETVGEEH
jgi:hypothetical protein